MCIIIIVYFEDLVLQNSKQFFFSNFSLWGRTVSPPGDLITYSRLLSVVRYEVILTSPTFSQCLLGILSFILQSVLAKNYSASLLLPKPHSTFKFREHGPSFQHYQTECLFSPVIVFISACFSSKHCCFFTLHKADSHVQSYFFHLFSDQQSICDSQSLADSWGNCLLCLICCFLSNGGSKE